MSPVLIALLSKWLGKGGGVNPYFNNPGSAPYNDSTFDANAQLPMQPNNIWQQLAGDDWANKVNAQYMSTLSQQPLVKELARFQSDLGLESKKKGLGIEREAKDIEEHQKAEQLGKTALDVLSRRGNLSSIPGSGGSYENIGRGLMFAHPKIGEQGLTTFGKTEADIAQNLASQIASENAAIQGRTQQPYIAPTTRNIAERGNIESTLGLNFAQSPDFQNRIYPTSESWKYLKPFEVGPGQEWYDMANRTKITGMTPTERQVNKVMNIGGKEIAIPEMIRGYNPGSVSPFGASNVITNPNPAPPAEVKTPARNQETTIGTNPLVPANEEELRALNLWRAQRGLPPIQR